VRNCPKLLIFWTKYFCSFQRKAAEMLDRLEKLQQEFLPNIEKRFIMMKLYKSK